MTLTADRVRELLAYDPETGLLTRLTSNGRGCNVGDQIGSLHRSGYNVAMVDRRNYLYHRIVWLHVHGSWPAEDIDHINGIKTDNRIANLRDVPTSMNMQNERKARKNNASGFMGVHYRKDRGKWIATVRVNGKSIRLGSFSTPEEAEQAYVVGKRRFHPGFCL